ncbi:MAG: formylglycine-generating enzyme family protein [Thermodesulfobacteriota bacterium]
MKMSALRELLAALCMVLPAEAPAAGILNLERFTNSLGMEFVMVPPGSFLMGSPASEAFRDEDEVQHRVTLSRPFLMQVTEVTQRQLKAVMGSNPSFFSQCGDDCPVERVSWNDSVRFVEAMNRRGEGRYRLATEAEWEYACRAGTTSPFSWGDEPDCNMAMFNNNPRRGVARCLAQVLARGLKPDSPAPAGSYPPNRWGLFDMHGNVWEWCQDWYGPYPKGEVTDPVGPPHGMYKVRRGGSWFKYGTFCRSANRNFAHPASRYSTTGLRLVREPSPEKTGTQ